MASLAQDAALRCRVLARLEERSFLQLDVLAFVDWTAFFRLPDFLAAHRACSIDACTDQQQKYDDGGDDRQMLSIAFAPPLIRVRVAIHCSKLEAML